ncbi:MAG: hypothetical protein J2P31_17985 [Blastocatellia bacterium]|nr:hypothetical protein [Blastocatellia bacterium]
MLRIEGKFLGDDGQYERLLAIEDELFYDYAQGKLTPADRARFEERFLTSAPNRQKAALAAALAQKFSEVEMAETAEQPATGDRERKRRSLKSYFSDLNIQSIQQKTVMWFSLASLAALLLVSLWLAVGTMKLRNEFERFRAERMVQEDRLEQQAQKERARVDELNLKLKRQTDENALLKEELSKIQPNSLKQGQEERQVENNSSMLSLALAPSFIRDSGSGIKKLRIPPGVNLLKIQLNLKGEVEYKIYQAILLTADGLKKWSQDRLSAQPAGSGKAVVLRLPSRLLSVGDYELRVKGYASDGSLQETGDYYYLSIVK